MEWQWWYWITLFVTAAVSFFPLLPYNLANLSHEAAHWFFVKVKYGIGGRIKPYWHYSFEDKKWRSPRYWADASIPREKHALHSIGPIIFDSAWIAILILLMIFIDNDVVRIHLALPAVGFLFDFGWFWRGFWWGTTGCDGKRWRYGATGKP